MGIAARLYERRVRQVYREVAGRLRLSQMRARDRPLLDVWIIHSQVLILVHRKLGTGSHPDHKERVEAAAYRELATQLGMTTDQLDAWRTSGGTQ